MQSGLVCEQGNLYKQFGIIIITAAKEAGNGDHGAIGSMMQTSEMVFFCFGRDELDFVFKGNVFADIYCDQASFSFLYYIDFGKIHCQQGRHILAVCAEGCPDCLQMGDPQVKVSDLFVQKAFQVFGGAVLHEILYDWDGDFQLPEQQNGFQYGALVVIIAAVSVFRVDRGRPEQAYLIIPHQCFFVYAMECGELSDGKRLVCAHFSVSC